MKDNVYHSSLDDDEIFEECAAIEREREAGKNMTLETYCRRLGISLETALAMAAEHASRLHGRPMTIEVARIDGQAVGYRIVNLN
ncbi:hypothetical protein [Rhizobium leguminosarum]|uniref:hypothetical protein n=1 Tax=Rhizobium leguminosarum TaxID=384 RepID=UPI00103A4D36|nr:hypothetical protein [Rhizobium leguminosarum]TBZ75890.1 hypothetical protein E0H43_08545 [Rhizobium leguminosarum bv. viciae]